MEASYVEEGALPAGLQLTLVASSVEDPEVALAFQEAKEEPPSLASWDLLAHLLEEVEEVVAVLPYWGVVVEHQEEVKEVVAFHLRVVEAEEEFLASYPWNLGEGLVGVVEGTYFQEMVVVEAS